MRRKSLVQRAARAATPARFERLEERRMLALIPFNPEFLVNNTTDNHQREPSIAMDADGDFVIAWAGYYAPSGIDLKDGVFIQRYKKNGDPLGSEFLVNTYTTGNQNQAAVAMSDGGRFVVVWTSETQDGDGLGIYGQRFDTDGTPLGSEFRVNTYTTGDQLAPAIAMDAVGNFVVSWTSAGQDGSDFGIFAQRFGFDGSLQGSELAINTFTAGTQQASSVAMDDSGDFVVAWESYGQEDTGSYLVEWGVYARRYDSLGGALDVSEFLVNSVTTGPQRAPSVAMDATGNFVVGFQDLDADGEGIRARRFNAGGVAQGGDILVNTTVAAAQTAPAVAVDGAGNFVVAWESQGQDGSGKGIFAQHFNSSGVMLGTEFLVNSFVGADQRLPTIAASHDGKFGIAWESVNQDLSQEGIYAQLYDQQTPPPWPFDTETQLHTFTSGTQERPQVAISTGGDIIVVWQSYGEDGDGFGVFGQRYSPLGIPRGLEFRINSTTAGDQVFPTVSINALGGFVVVWQGGDGDGWGVFGQRYDNLGNPVAGEFAINSVTAGNQSLPDVAMDSSGRFVVTWESFGQDGAGYGIYARSYDVLGVAAEPEFQVNTYTTGEQTTPAIAIDPDGNYVIVWQSEGQDTDTGYGIYAQRFDALSEPVGSEFHVNTYTENHQYDPDVSMDTEGRFVVVWTSSFQVTASSVHFQRYDELGIPGAEGEVRVDTGASVGGTSASVAMDGAGNFTVAWQENDDDSTDEEAGIMARRYNGDGTARGTVLHINTYTSAGQVNPAVASNAVGDVAIVWTDQERDALTDGGIFGKRLEHLTSGIVTGGAPFQINTFTTGNQFASSIAIDTDGDFIVVWNSFNQTGTEELPGDLEYGIYAQRYDAAGNKLGTEIHINEFTTGNQQNPVVAWGPGGSFIVAWQSNAFPFGGVGFDIIARRFDATGAPAGSEFVVNTEPGFNQTEPSLAIDGDGDFVVVWRSFGQEANGYEVYARRFFASDQDESMEFRVNTHTTFNQNFPVVAMDNDGNFVVAWQSYNQTLNSPHFDIYARRYDVDGVATGLTEFLVNEYTTNAQANPTIAMAPTGEFVIAWDSVNQLENGPVIFSGLDIFARMYSNTLDVNGDPVPSSPEFPVNTYTSSEQRLPAVAMDDGGNVVVAWASRFQDGDQYGIYTQRFNASGAAVDGETQVNVWTTGSQFAPAVASDPDGDFTVTWQSTGGQDGSLAGVFGRRFTVGGINPVVLARNFVWQSFPQRLEFIVDRNVAASLDPMDLVLENLTTNTVMTGVVASFDPVSNTIIFTWPTAGPGGALPNGRYRARLIGSGVTDGSGNSIGADQVVEFFFINGDANHDGFVDLRDLFAMSQKWLQPSGFNYTMGDFNYDGFVDKQDLTILSQNWQVDLAMLAPALPAPPAVTTAPPPEQTAPEEPAPATPPTRSPTRTPTRVTASPAPSEATAAETQVEPESAPQPQVPAPELAPITVVEADPASASAQSQSDPAPVVEVESTTPPPAPVVEEQAPAPVAQQDPVPQAPAPTVAPAQSTSPFADGPAIQSEAQPPPPRRTPSRSAFRAASLVDL